eukprot:TRINITY_DN6753_c0_g1_i1.p2 TRINITY_DN6753_c0_g1~~TRINITY_DN6753_c0_g1_i1.p2  ORF type:complete len:149 (-),score=71.28 TRINITY_DN6753_c0_g1_i1:135-581(-)
MSDTEGEATPVVENTTGETTAAAEKMDVFEALQKVLKTSLIHDGLVRGLRQAVKALDRRQAHLCVLAGNVDEPNYVALVRALCDEHEVKLVKVPESKQLGEWVGLCKIDDEGNPRKVVGCGCAVVKDFGEDTEALQVLLEYLSARGKE